MNDVMFKNVDGIAKKRGAKPSQLALAWVEAQQRRAAGVIAIPGTNKERICFPTLLQSRLSSPRKKYKRWKPLFPMSKWLATMKKEEERHSRAIAIHSFLPEKQRLWVSEEGLHFVEIKILAYKYMLKLSEDH